MHSSFTKFLVLSKIKNKPVRINKKSINQIITLNKTVVILESGEKILANDNSFSKMPIKINVKPRIFFFM